MQGYQRLFFLYGLPAIILVVLLNTVPAMMSPYLSFLVQWTPYAVTGLIGAFTFYIYRKWILKRAKAGDN